eukprot:COSAG02_NODE_4151_length_5709_cov_21.395187_6_plen_129_part_00
MQQALSFACLGLALAAPRLSAIDGLELLCGCCAVCAATRASILTGRYVQRLGYQHNNPPKAVRRICTSACRSSLSTHPPFAFACLRGSSSKMTMCWALQFGGVGGIPLGEKLLGEYMRDAGYATHVRP